MKLLVIVVTGASSGIGLTTARMAARRASFASPRLSEALSGGAENRAVVFD